MPEPLLFLAVFATLAILCVLLRRAVWRERRAQAREAMDRVYYPRRFTKEDVPE